MVTCAAALLTLRGEARGITERGLWGACKLQRGFCDMQLAFLCDAACFACGPAFLPTNAVHPCSWYNKAPAMTLPSPPLFAGTPLEPSKRRLVVWLSGAFVLSIPINFGLLAWGAWVVEAGDGSCWSSDDKKMPGALTRSAAAVHMVCWCSWLFLTAQLGEAQGLVCSHVLAAMRCCTCCFRLFSAVPTCDPTRVLMHATASLAPPAATIFFGGLGVPVGQL